MGDGVTIEEMEKISKSNQNLGKESGEDIWIPALCGRHLDSGVMRGVLCG